MRAERLALEEEGLEALQHSHVGNLGVEEMAQLGSELDSPEPKGRRQQSWWLVLVLPVLQRQAGPTGLAASPSGLIPGH